MIPGRDGPKRRRFAPEMVQEKLVEVCQMAAGQNLMYLQEDPYNIVIKCPHVNCTCKGKSELYSLIIEKRDEATFEPLSFSDSPGRDKLLNHLRKVHTEWYRQENETFHVPALSNAQSRDPVEMHGEEDYRYSYYIEEEEEEEVLPGEYEYEEEDEEEYHPIFTLEDFDGESDLEDGKKLPSRRCQTVKELHKYRDIDIGGGPVPECGFHETLTPRKLAIMLEEFRIRYKLPQEGVQSMLTMLMISLPKEQSYVIPSSVHLLDSFVEVESLKSKEVHMCICCQQYPPVEDGKSDEEKKEETCPDCHIRRYDIVNGRLKPKMMMYYHGVRKQIEALFQNPTFRRQRTRGRDDADGIYKSKSITQDLRSIVPEILETNRSIYSIAIDGAQPFKKRIHSSTNIVMRCEDLPLSHRCKGSYSRMLAIIPGPKEPSDHNPYLCVIAREFNDLTEKGMKIKYKNEDGKEEEITHYPVFRFIYGDAKAMEKTYQYVSCTAKNGCRFCTQIASQYEVTTKDNVTRKVSRITGFTSEATFRKPGEETTTTCIQRTHDAEIPRNSREQTWEILYRCKQAQEAKICGDDPRGVLLQRLTEIHGWKGLPGVFEVSKTLDILDSTPLPNYHMLLLGVVKNFVQYLYDGLKTTGTQYSRIPGRKMKILVTKKELEKLESAVFTNFQVKKPYTQLHLCYTWISEEVGVFLEVFSAFLFNSQALGVRVISQEAEQAWHLLRQVVLYYLGRPTEEKMDMDIAHQKIYEFAKICEEENYLALVKPNLHTAICRLREQEKVLGHLRHLGELWMERALRIISAANAVNFVEGSLVKWHLLREAIERQKLIVGMPLDQFSIPIYQPRKNIPKNSVTLCDIDGETTPGRGDSARIFRFKGQGSEMKHSGRLNTGNDPIARKMGDLWIRETNLPGNSKLSQDEFKRSHAIIQFNSLVKEREDGAYVCGEVKSKSKTREMKRKSYIVEVAYQTADQVATTELAEVDTFFMIARVDRSTQGKAINIAGDQQRFALCHVLKTRKLSDLYILDYKLWENTYLQKNLVIPVSDIGRSVNGIMTTLQTSESGQVIERMVFKPHLTDHEDTYCKD